MRIVLLILVLIAHGAPARADYLCYQRSYDDAHLAGHPAQAVRTIWLDLIDGEVVELQVWFRGDSGTHAGHAGRFNCEAAGARLACTDEGGESGFTLEGALTEEIVLRAGRLELTRCPDTGSCKTRDIRDDGAAETAFRLRLGACG